MSSLPVSSPTGNQSGIGLGASLVDASKNGPVINRLLHNLGILAISVFEARSLHISEKVGSAGAVLRSILTDAESSGIAFGKDLMEKMKHAAVGVIPEKERDEIMRALDLFKGLGSAILEEDLIGKIGQGKVGSLPQDQKDKIVEALRFFGELKGVDLSEDLIEKIKQGTIDALPEEWKAEITEALVFFRELGNVVSNEDLMEKIMGGAIETLSPALQIEAKKTLVTAGEKFLVIIKALGVALVSIASIVEDVIRTTFSLVKKTVDNLEDMISKAVDEYGQGNLELTPGAAVRVASKTRIFKDIFVELLGLVKKIFVDFKIAEGAIKSMGLSPDDQTKALKAIYDAESEVLKEKAILEFALSKIIGLEDAPQEAVA